jgi:hypothetical protein
LKVGNVRDDTLVIGAVGHTIERASIDRLNRHAIGLAYSNDIRQDPGRSCSLGYVQPISRTTCPERFQNRVAAPNQRHAAAHPRKAPTELTA